MPSGTQGPPLRLCATMKVSSGVASLMRAFDQPPAPAPAPRTAAVPTKRVVIDTRKELTELLARVAASDPSLVTLDLSSNRQFASLAPAIKNQTLVRMAIGEAVQTILLHAVDLSNVNAPAVAELLRSSPKLCGLSLEENNFSEEGLHLIAEAMEGHPNLSELSVAHQRTIISTASQQRLIAAMEATPSLVSLGLGAVRDDAISRRLQKATMVNTESMRVRRLSCRQADNGAPAAAGGGLLRRRAMSFDRQQKRGPAGPAPARRQLSGALQAASPPRPPPTHSQAFHVPPALTLPAPPHRTPRRNQDPIKRQWNPNQDSSY